MKTLTRFFLPFAAFLVLASGAYAQSVDALQNSIRERLPAVTALRVNGIAGETNRGYLEARGSVTSEQRATISAENRDRRALYGIVARQAGANLNQVEAQRAEQIRRTAPAGTWIQAPNGSWSRK